MDTYKLEQRKRHTSKSINILDHDYLQWVQELCKRYRQCQIKAAVKVNSEMIRFYWELGRDIVELHAEKRWGEKVMSRLSADLRDAMPGVTGLTQRNIYYCKQFYLLFTPILESLPQAGAKLQRGRISTNLGEYLKYLGDITA